MTLVLSIALILLSLEAVGWLLGPGRYAKLASVFIVTNISGTMLVALGWFNGFSLLAAVWVAYRVFNLVRATHREKQADYLFRVTRDTGLRLYILQLFTIGLAINEQLISPYTPFAEMSTLLLMLAVAGLLAESTKRNLERTAPLSVTTHYSDHDLPTLTVCIPARNETSDLELCLQSLVASRYPKLEILVLDDCSQNSRTPEIIRQFAHEGVRFIAGKVPPENWLAKNFAYQQLADAANGEVLLFCGVDVRFEPLSLNRMVETMLDKRKSMLSVIPRNLAPASTKYGAVLLQPSRYAWQLALPRRFLKRPACLSTCWLIKKDLLESAGGFAGFSRSILPETHLARRAVQESDGYSFVQSDSSVGLTCLKSFDEQRSTAIRTRYPQLHRRPELVALLTVLQFVVLVLPYALAVFSLVRGLWIPLVLALGCIGLITYSYARIVSLTYRQFLVRGLWLLPFAALYDIVLLNYSMYRYECSDVVWKGRNVCIPVMRVIPSLPKYQK